MSKRNALAMESLVLERKDESGGGALAEIVREVKTFGQDVKGLKESMQKDLADVRKIAEEAKGAIGPEVKAQIDALQTSVMEKHTAIEKIVSGLKEQTDRVETAIKRSPKGGTEEGEKNVGDALKFFEVKAAVSGGLRVSNRPTAETIDLEAYKSWEKAYGDYLRVSDERSIEAKALSVGSNPDGGYLIPTARSTRIIQRIFETSPIRRLATVETIGSSELEIPVDVEDVDSGWVGEEQARPQTGNATIGVQKIPVHEIYAKPRATQKFLEDAAINVEGWHEAKVADRFARREATGFVTGNGVNKPRGILSYQPGVGRERLRQVNSGHATQITADAIVGLPLEIISAYLANAAWLMKRSTVQAVMLLKDGQGQYLWRPSLVAGQPSILGGFPVEMADDMPIVGAGNLPIAFGDFRRGYTVVDRLGITTLRDPYSAKPFVEFYSRKRVGGAVVDFDALVLMKVAA